MAGAAAGGLSGWNARGAGGGAIGVALAETDDSPDQLGFGFTLADPETHDPPDRSGFGFTAELGDVECVGRSFRGVGPGDFDGNFGIDSRGEIEPQGARWPQLSLGG